MFLTVGFLLMYVGNVLAFRNETMDRSRKLLFDTFTTTYLLGLGLNFFEAFKGMAKIARWRILSNRFFEDYEVDLILGAESLMKLFHLIVWSRRKPLLCLICLVWLLINLGAQSLVAILPTFASSKSGYNSSCITISQGLVSVPKLDCFYRSNTTECDVNQDRLDPAVAHKYGEQERFVAKAAAIKALTILARANKLALILSVMIGANLRSVTPIPIP